MATETNQNSSASTGGDSPASSAGTSGSNAGSTAIGAAPGIAPNAAPVVARLGFRVALQHMLQGFQAAIPGDSSMTTSAGSLAQADVVARLQEYLGSYTDLDTKATAYKQAQQPVKSQLPAAKQFHALLKRAMANQFGPESPTLAQFGLRPKRAPRARTASQLAVQAAKARATRQLRGTMGALQKAPIKAGAMKFVEPVPDAATASTAQPQTEAGAVSPQTAK